MSDLSDAPDPRDKFIEHKDITPEFARWVIAHKNKINRNPNERNITRYASDMKKGNWRTNGETIKFKPNGDLADGQNRLIAVLRSDTTQRMAVAYNVTDDDMTTVDTGRSRSFGDVLSLNREKNVHQLSSATQALYYYYFPAHEVSSSLRPTHEVMKEFFYDHEGIRNVLNDSLRISMNTKLARGAVGALAYVIQDQHGWECEQWNAFRDKLVYGNNMDYGDPCLALRNFGLLGGTVAKNKGLKKEARAFRRETMLGGIKCWNAYFMGKELRKLRVGDEEKYPDIL